MEKTKSKPKTTKGMKYKRRAIDPRQAAFLSYYNDPQSPTFSNALQSAEKAGYTREYAESITVQNPDLLSRVNYAEMLTVAEKNLHDVLTQTATDIQEKKLKADVSKFVTERLGKGNWSTRSESVNVHIQAVSAETKEQINKALDDVL